MINPAESGGMAFAFRELYAMNKTLSDRVARLESNVPVTLERATITSYTGGSTQCTVTYATGQVRVVGFVTDYTPVVGNAALIINSALGAWVIGPPSV